MTNYYSGKRILVTGATGLIGSNLVRRLLTTENATVIALGRNRCKIETVFKDCVGNPRFEILEHDVACPLHILDPIDSIFHAAGPMEPSIVDNYPVEVIKPNILGIINLLELCKQIKSSSKHSCRLVVFSSVTVYNHQNSTDTTVSEAETNMSYSIDSPKVCYSESKRMIEVIAKSYAKEYDVDAVIARFSTVYGPTFPTPNTAFFDFLGKAMNGEDVVVKAKGAPRRDNIYVDDAVDGLLKLGEYGIKGESYNISSNGELGNFKAVDEIAGDIVKVANKTIGGRGKIRLIAPEQPPMRIAGMKLDNTKLKKLGWRVKTSHIDGIVNTLKKQLQEKC